MATYVVFGDAEAAVVDILRAATQVAAFTGVAVATDLVGYAQGARWVRASRVGGSPLMWTLTDNPTVEVEAYAEDKATAYDLAQAARAALFAAQGYVGHGLRLYDVADDNAGLRWAPEEQRPRYVFTVSLVTRPEA